jgi:hypothetical protein
MKVEGGEREGWEREGIMGYERMREVKGRRREQGRNYGV